MRGSPPLYPMHGVAVLLKFWSEKPPHIFQHHGLWVTFSDKSQCLWEQIPPVKLSQLFSGHRKGGHGTPPAKRSTPKYFSAEKDATSHSTTFQRGRFFSALHMRCGQFPPTRHVQNQLVPNQAPAHQPQRKFPRNTTVLSIASKPNLNCTALIAASCSL